MLRHRDVWRGIDKLAKGHGYSPSGLARAAGLDPTSFNKSKRTGPNGRERWPSTESLAKIFRVTGTTLADFVKLAGKSAGTVGSRKYPSNTLSRAGRANAFGDDGLPGEGWTALDAPDISDDDAFALNITSNEFAPVLAKGTVLLVSPGAEVKRGDKIVLGTNDGSLHLGTVARMNRKEIAITPLAGRRWEIKCATAEAVIAHKIMWASQ